MTPPRTTKTLGRPKRTGQDAPTNDTIIRTASKLFMEHGYEPISLNQIAQLCNVTKASLYYHFANKAVLFTESLIWMLTVSRVNTEKLLEQAADIRSGLEKLALVKMSTPHMDFESMMRDATPHLSEEQLTRIRAAEEAIHGVLAHYFRQAIDAGQLRPANPLLLSHTLSALLMLGNRRHPADLFQSTPELAKAMVDLFWNGVAPA
ncbi:TetR/AcrR family transcriptional regulator [Paenibacillus sp. MMS18-CY102]|uniref:TetR/AcrR family transcriptional regulator n=1 Tax=Paenibacillus sp. MMS18-CY102 TaxID=2682849 RepID=UPI001365C187|nr:TetR/AcrR family transcriptional regulator [Paenibacillus sp. MMS18-CY102]MWC29928.1 TetR family transcriptional regulator [Paenibacillus sp. MMS18-CY102]